MKTKLFFAFLFVCTFGLHQFSNAYEGIKKEPLTAQSEANSNCPDLESDGCEPEVSASFMDCYNVTVCSAKDLSNVVLDYSPQGAGPEDVKYEDLSGLTDDFSSDEPILGVWIKSGCNQSGDGPGYGEYVMNQLDCESTVTPVEDLILTSFCSFDESSRRWRVRNPNQTPIEVTWLVVSSQETGMFTAEPGDSFFFTSNDGGANTTKIFWDDENGDENETVKASSNQICPQDPDPEEDPEDEGCYGYTMVEYNPGPNVPAGRDDPNRALGEPDRSNAANDDEIGFVSLGRDGYIILKFAGAVLNQAGPDIAVWETTFGSNGDNCSGGSSEEFAEIAVSKDGISYRSFPEYICRDSGPLDLDEVDLEYIQYIKIIDRSEGMGFGADKSYDLDGVEALNGCGEVPEDEDSDICENYAAFYIDVAQGANNGVLNGVTFENGTATFTELVELNYSAHLSFDPIAEKVYVNNGNGSFIEVFDTAGNSEGIIDLSGANLGGTPTSAFSRGFVYLGSSSLNSIVKVNVLTGTWETWATNVPVSGGDIEFRNGLLYLATRSGDKLWQVNPGDNQKTLVGTTEEDVNGMALAPNSDNFLTTNAGVSVVYVIDADNGSTVDTYDAVKNGEPFELFNGDLASGCSENNGGEDPVDCSQYVAYYADHLGDVSDIYGVAFAGNDAIFDLVTTRDYEVHLAYNSDDGYIYAIDADNATLERIDPEFGTGESVDLVPAAGEDALGKVTAITYEDGRLWIGSDQNNAVYVTNVFGAVDMSLEFSYVQDAPVSGGDIAWKDGRMFLASRQGNQLVRLDAGNSTTVVSAIPGKVTGLAVSENNEFLITNKDSSVIFALDNNGGVVNQYNVTGAISVLRNGDFSSGCQDAGAGDPFCSVSALENPGAENADPSLPDFNNGWEQYASGQEPAWLGWSTTTSIEVQQTGRVDGNDSYAGEFHFELLSRNIGDNMYQEVVTIPGQMYHVGFWHKQRRFNGNLDVVDEMEVLAGPDLNSIVKLGATVATSGSEWVYIERCFEATSETTVVMLRGLSGTTVSIGNLIDDVFIACGPGEACDSDGDSNDEPRTRLVPLQDEEVDNVIIDASRVAVYPVPASSEINIKVDNSGSIVDGTYYITNMSGRTSHQGTISIVDGESSVVKENVSSLPQGVYFLVMELNGRQITKKIVKLPN